ncbi:MAG TPA: hypothetical protein PLD25_16510 [Chloroflexota bacterium]|nr:hypothetical protein [Chloroflexota bacterium]HUM70756.1 hypothetical protein [Chloroflexota bacterium]
MAYVAIAAAVANATKATGTIVHIEPDDWLQLVERIAEPLVVMGMGGILSKHYQYLVSYKGLAFYARSHEKLPLPPQAELITAKKIWIPDM